MFLPEIQAAQSAAGDVSFQSPGATLPAVPRDASADPRTRSEPSGASARSDVAAHPSAAAEQRVLIVDDNHDAAESLAMLVELLGNPAQVAFDGPAALSAVTQFRPLIVLLDLSMPGMDGFAVARALRAQSGGAALRLVALSGRGDDDDRRQSRAAGFDSHLVKPVDLPTLQAVLSGHHPA